MTIRTQCLIMLAVGALPGCSKPEARSVTYFAAHLDEARTIVAACSAGSVRGAECGNADSAVQRADAAARFKRFRGD